MDSQPPRPHCHFSPDVRRRLFRPAVMEESGRRRHRSDVEEVGHDIFRSDAMDPRGAW